MRHFRKVDDPPLSPRLPAKTAGRVNINTHLPPNAACKRRPDAARYSGVHPIPCRRAHKPKYRRSARLKPHCDATSSNGRRSPAALDADIRRIMTRTAPRRAIAALSGSAAKTPSVSKRLRLVQHPAPGNRPERRLDIPVITAERRRPDHRPARLRAHGQRHHAIRHRRRRSQTTSPPACAPDHAGCGSCRATK